MNMQCQYGAAYYFKHIFMWSLDAITQCKYPLPVVVPGIWRAKYKAISSGFLSARRVIFFND